MKKRLTNFYSVYGDRGVMFLLYSISVVANSLITMSMELPSIYPDEIRTACIAAYYSGRDWSGIMPQGEPVGYIQAVFYTPLFWLFGSSPYALYKSMVVMNGVLVSFIPPVAYHMAAKLNVEEVWQKIVIAVSCGAYVTYIANSKFIWNEAICCLMPWVMVWCIYMAWDRKNKYSRFTMSVLSGFLCAVCYAADERLTAVIAAFAATVLIFRIFFKERIFNLPVMVIAAAASFMTEHFCRLMIEDATQSAAQAVSSVQAESGGFIATLFGHLYTFFTATLGVGALAAALLIIILIGITNDFLKNLSARKNTEAGEDGTRRYSAPERTFNTRILLFGVYTFFTVGISLVMSVVSDSDRIISGRFADSVAPLSVFFVLVFIMHYGIKLRHIFTAAGIYGFTCLIFALNGYDSASEEYLRSTVLGVLPWRISEDISAPFTGMSFVIMSSCVFTAFSLMIVLISSTRHHRVGAISFVICGAFLYSSLFAANVYLPDITEENADKIHPAQSISALIYDDPQSPDVVAYYIPQRTAALVQFLNPSARVCNITEKRDIPENCILITEVTRSMPFEKGTYDVVGIAEGYAVYAYGNAARDFVRFKGSS